MLATTKENIYATINHYLLFLLMGTLPFTHFFTLPIALIMFLLFCIEKNWKEKINIIKINHLTIPFWIVVSFFILYLIGTIYSTNISSALSDLECKIWFLIAPLCLFPFFRYFSLQKANHLLLIFCFSTLLFCITNFIISTINYAQIGDKSLFFYTNASHWQHPSYAAMYATFSWIIAIYFLWIKPQSIHKIGKFTLYFSIVILPIYIILLQSKAGILIFGIIFIIVVSLLINLKRKRPFLTIGIIMSCLLAIISFIIMDNSSTNRLKTSIVEYKESNFSNPENGTAQRVVIWKNAFDLCVDNFPMGCGTGDAKEALNKTYKEKNYTYILDRQLNCHNQYLQTCLTIGLLGIISLLTLLIYPFLKAIKEKDTLAILFIVIIILNMLVESMLEVRAGANFIPLMLVILFLRMKTMQTEGK